MIYISIPEGMEFRQIKKGNEKHDVFAGSSGEQIDLQSLVKDALRANTGRRKTIELKEFTIYTKVPPNVNKNFLKYAPNNNGKFATTVEPTLVNGLTEQRFQPQMLTRYSMFWDQTLHLDAQKKQEVLDKREEQKYNRRHDGDSPKST